jgi:hypothetical protein
MQRRDWKARAIRLVVFMAAMTLGTLLTPRYAWAQG